MYYNFTETQLREMSRSSIETLEIWAKRLIDDKMSAKYGQDYLNFRFDDGDFLIKKDVRKRADNLINNNPDRFPRMADALFLEDICYILCNPRLYKSLFKEALDYIYPQGVDEAREFLNRLIPIRNSLSHANSISVRYAEQAVCYSNDFVEGLKKYYKDKGMEKTWVVPSIIRAWDSFGNIYENLSGAGESRSHIVKQPCRCGEKYSIHIEIDPSFLPDEYDIKWCLNRNRHVQNGGYHFEVKFEEDDVGEERFVFCYIVSKKGWHKYDKYDYCLALQLIVLPPLQN